MLTDFPVTRTAAHAQLTAFLASAAPDYAAQRNYVRPGHAAVSRLSPALQKRLLTEEEVVAATLARWPLARVEKFVQEVYWRTYWKGWLEQRPTAWTRWREACAPLRAQLPPALADTYAAALAGRTGLAGFDDWARELVATGYLHNHARMWFASIWIFTLRLPWELGAEFFWRHLLDGDAASNTLSWRWVAGLQTPGKTYVATAANIARYTDGAVTLPDSALAPAAFPVVETPLPRAPLWSDSAPLPPADAHLGLWLHPEDLAAENGELASTRPRALFAAWPEDVAAAAGWSDAVRRHTHTALLDGAARASAHFSAPVETSVAPALAPALAAWAAREHLTHVIAYRPFVGPWLDITPALERALHAAGVTVLWQRRAWDAQWFPHATRGYFPFWETVRAAHRS